MGAAQQMMVSYSAGGLVASYATWNPADKDASITLSNGNLTASGTAVVATVRSTIGKSTGKWYWETTQVSAPSNTYLNGIANSTALLNNYTGSDTNGWAYYGNSGNEVNNATFTAYGASYTASNIIGIALDMTAGTLTFYKNNVSQGVAFSGLAGTIFAAVGTINNAAVYTTNFGATAFTYAPPTGFNAGLYN